MQKVVGSSPISRSQEVPAFTRNLGPEAPASRTAAGPSSCSGDGSGTRPPGRTESPPSFVDELEPPLTIVRLDTADRHDCVALRRLVRRRSSRTRSRSSREHDTHNGPPRRCKYGGPAVMRARPSRAWTCARSSRRPAAATDVRRSALLGQRSRTIATSATNNSAVVVATTTFATTFARSDREPPCPSTRSGMCWLRSGSSSIKALLVAHLKARCSPDHGLLAMGCTAHSAHNCCSPLARGSAVCPGCGRLTSAWLLAGGIERGATARSPRAYALSENGG
jgi:hypothetical protein